MSTIILKKFFENKKIIVFNSEDIPWVDDISDIQQEITDLETNKADKLQNNLEAITDPTVTNDETEWYSVLSVWVNTLTNEYFKALSVTEWAAVWVKSSLTLDELWSMALEDADNYYTKEDIDWFTSDDIEMWITNLYAANGINFLPTWNWPYTTTILQQKINRLSVNPSVDWTLVTEWMQDWDWLMVQNVWTTNTITSSNWISVEPRARRMYLYFNNTWQLISFSFISNYNLTVNSLSANSIDVSFLEWQTTILRTLDWTNWEISISPQQFSWLRITPTETYNTISTVWQVKWSMISVSNLSSSINITLLWTSSWWWVNIITPLMTSVFIYDWSLYRRMFEIPSISYIDNNNSLFQLNNSVEFFPWDVTLVWTEQRNKVYLMWATEWNATITINPTLFINWYTITVFNSSDNTITIDATTWNAINFEWQTFTLTARNQSVTLYKWWNDVWLILSKNY